MCVLLCNWCGLLLSDVILSVLTRFIIHRPVLVHLLPLSIIRPKCFTWQWIFVNFTSHPALHSFTTDIRECDANPGILWTYLAPVGSCVRFSVHVWVDDTHVPSVSLTLNGLLAGVILVICAVLTRKWLVAPESSIAQYFINFVYFSFLWCLEVFVYLLGSMHMDFPILLVFLMHLDLYQFSLMVFYGASGE